MEEIKLKRLILFLLESLVLQGYNEATDGFVYSFNEFIYNYYRENKEILDIIYDTEKLGKFIKKNYEILSLKQMEQLVSRYNFTENYLRLLDDISKDDADEINQLVILFIKFRQETIDLYYADSNKYYPKGYSKILQ